MLWERVLQGSGFVLAPVGERNNVVDCEPLKGAALDWQLAYFAEKAAGRLGYQTGRPPTLTRASPDD